MKKTLLALAVAGVVAAPAAMAEVTVYGQAHVSVGTEDNGTKSVTAVESNSSRFGVKAAESLDGGLTAVAQYEFGVAVDQADANKDVVTGRNSFVGLAGGFGTILAGRHDAPLKMSTGALDIFADTVADYNSVVGLNGATDVRANNAIAYVTPTFAGATVVLAYVPDENPKGNGDKTGGELGGDFDATSAALMWGNGPLAIDVGYLGANDFKMSNAAGGFYKNHDLGVAADVTDLRFGVGYTVTDALKIGFVYDTIEAKIAEGGLKGNKVKSSDWLVNAAFGFGGGNTLKAEYGVISDDSNSTVTGVVTAADGGTAGTKNNATFMAVGLDHAFSKTTSAYLVYASMANDKNARYALGAVGPGTNLSPAAGKDPSSVQVGMVVKF